METATIERTLYCDEIPNVTVNASEDAAVKVVINVVNSDGKKTTVVMGWAGEQEMAQAGMIVAPDYNGFSARTEVREHWVSGRVDEDDFTALLYWLNRYPNMVAIFREKAERLGNEYDAIAAGHEPQAPDDAMQATA